MEAVEPLFLLNPVLVQLVQGAFRALSLQGRELSSASTTVITGSISFYAQRINFGDPKSAFDVTFPGSSPVPIAFQREAHLETPFQKRLVCLDPPLLQEILSRKHQGR